MPAARGADRDLHRAAVVAARRAAGRDLPGTGRGRHGEGDRHMMAASRCWESADEAYNRYHDEEWGRPVVDERGLYEKLCLEGFQSGLSWLTILRKREAFRAGFAGFVPERVAAFGPADVDRLLADRGIVRNRAKVEAAVANARATLQLPDGLAPLLWSFAPDPATRPRPRSFAEVPPITAESTAMAKELRRRGFRF